MTQLQHPDPHVLDRLKTLSRFLTVFDRATDRGVRTLALLVASAFAQHAQRLRSRAGEQNDVLAQIAHMVGLPDPGEALKDANAEARVQRDVWQTASQWSLMVLLWTLAGTRTQDGPEEWASAAAHGDSKPMAGSALNHVDETLALELAAEALATSRELSEGRALLLCGEPFLVRVQDERAFADRINLQLLVHKRGGPTESPDELMPGDDVYFDDSRAEPELSVAHERKRAGAFVVTEAGSLGADRWQCAAVTDDIWAYWSGS